MGNFAHKIFGLFDLIHVKGLLAMFSVATLEIIGQNLVIYEVLFILVFVDLVTGVHNAVKKGKLKSGRGFLRTMYKLFLYYALVFSTHQLSRLVPMFDLMETFIASYLAGNELLSIIENVNKAGVKLPHWFKEKLEKYLEKDPTK